MFQDIKFEDLPVAPPSTLEDFEGEIKKIKKSIKKSGEILQPFGVEPDYLAGVYLVLHLPEHQGVQEDNQIIELIDGNLNTAPDPIMARARLGCHIAIYTFEKYIQWDRDYDKDEESIRLVSLKITGWIVDALKKDPQNEELRNAVINIGNRFNAGETFIREAEDMAKIEEAFGDKITINSIPNIEQDLGDLKNRIGEVLDKDK